MPATCTFLIHQFSLLLLVGLPLFVGSFPLASVSIPSPAAFSSSSSTDRSQFTATEPRGSSVSTREEPSFAAVSLLLLPREKESPQPSAAASVSAWDPATDRQHTSSSGNAAIMSSQEVVESSSTETRTSGSSQTYSTDVFNTLGKGRTFRTIASSNSMSTGATGSSTWYTGMTISGILAQHSSSVMQTEIADASSSAVDTAEFETVTSRIYSPKAPISSLSEKYYPATGTSQHIDSSWDAESRTSGLHTNSRGSLATVYRSAERTSQVLTDSITLTDSTRKDLISQKEFSTSADQTQFPNPDQTQFPSHATHSGGRNSTSNATQLPNSSSRTVFTPSHLAPKTTTEDHSQPQSSSNTEGRISSSRTDSLSLSELSDRAQGRTLQTLREISVVQIVTTSGNEISSSADLSESSSVLTPWPYRQMALSAGHPEVTEAFTEALVTYFQAPSETRAVEGSHQMRSSSNTETALSSSHQDKVSVSDVADKDEDRILQTLRDSSSSHNATQMSTMANTKTLSSTDISDSSYTWTVVQNTKMDVLLEAVTHSEAVSRITERENSDQLQSGSNTRSISPAHTESVSMSDPSDRDGEATRRPLRDISSSSTEAQIFTASSNEIPSSSGLTDPSDVWTPGQNRQIDRSAGVPDFTEMAGTLSEASSEATDFRALVQYRDKIKLLGMNVKGRVQKQIIDRKANY
ncbi:Serine--tRNA ligase [Varanus komodoensis]|nr:Serine--tRNA ligase [Varanus komodoensis]